MMVLGAWVAVATGCGGGGGGGSNDQGVSFRGAGVFQESLEQVAPAADTLPTAENAPGDTGRTIQLATTPFIPDDRNLDGDLDGGFIGLENNLSEQSVNVQGIDVEIFVPGARIPNPVISDFVPLSLTLPPAGVDDEGNPAPSKTFAQTLFVSSDVMAFLNQNQTLLPDPPFNINVVMRANARSDSGDSFDSNEFTYNLIVIP
jgi:hypothetical protein